MNGKDNKDFLNEFFGSKKHRDIPLIPLRDTVVFPRIAIPIVVKREASVKALEEAMKHGRTVAVAAQNDPAIDDPSVSQLHDIGSLAKVREMVKQDDGTIRVLVEGMARVKMVAVVQSEPFALVSVEPLRDPRFKKSERIEALTYSILNQFRRVVNMGANVSFDVLLVILNMSDPWLLGDLIAANIEMNVDEKQAVLESKSVEEKLDRVSKALGRQIKVLQMASKIQAETGKELDKMQREVFLREQLKSIEKELESLGGKIEDDGLKEKIEAAGMTAEVYERAMKEYRRLSSMPSFSPEQSYLRTYLEWLCELPWQDKNDSDIDLKKAKVILDEDHFGLDKAKERVLEFLAVQKLVGKMRGSILCFAGPPGTGKTSIGKSIARALGREFFRMSLGGIRDEAEIRGHRRTYVGALPGRIIQGIATVGSRNPVFMLDEIDKVGADFRGDPTAALLEALDPEQNGEFSDHYLEVPFDLSDVMFITTANMLETIPPALRDRMEVIEFPGYTENEKLKIAQGYLVPKSLEKNGLGKKSHDFKEGALKDIVRSYTMEAGVRNLERNISSVCRKIAKRKVEGEKVKPSVTAADLPVFLGPKKFAHLSASKKNEVGVANGLAWTETGGEILQIEATRMPGKGKLILTGQLGDVMQESAQAAFSYVRSQANKLGLDEDFYKDCDVHVHVPAGAIPKDGPSAGIAMATALISLLSGSPAIRTVGVTGEITLRGRVMEIGGVKEKCLAAHRAGLKRIVLPAENAKDLVDVPSEIKDELEFVFVSKMEEVIPLVLKRNGKKL
jgi:ATP-dependent Lon protease